jgi:type IV secretion system protein TrbL
MEMRKILRIRQRTLLRALLFATFGCVIVLLLAGTSSAQAVDPPSQMLNAYRSQRTVWFTNVYPAANRLFALLALIDFAWSAAVMVLEKQDFQSWAAALIRKMMTIGAFYALLIYGRVWIPAVVDSFEVLGQNAAGTGPLDPGDVFTRGLNLAGALIDGASTSGIFTNFGGALALVIAAVMCLLGFCMITIQFVMAMVESYILVAAAFVFLGFGGSRWSSSYVERYIALAVSVGVKIMLLYLLISTGMNVSLGWLPQAEAIATSTQPATDALSLMGASLIFAAICWHIPKLLAGILGGSPSLSGGDVVSTVATMLTAATFAGSTAMAAGRWVTGGATQAATSVAQAVGLGSGRSGSTVSERALTANAGNGSSKMSSTGPQQPPPPSTTSTSTSNARPNASPPKAA